MNSYLFCVFALIISVCAAQENDGGIVLKRTLPGRWKEDQYKRKNLNNFLYEMGKLIYFYFPQIGNKLNNFLDNPY